jgi:hypothetical protein
MFVPKKERGSNQYSTLLSEEVCELCMLLAVVRIVILCRDQKEVQVRVLYLHLLHTFT